MIVAPHLESEPHNESPDVELRGRRYPLSWEEPKNRPKNRIRQLAPAPQQADLPDLLAQRIRSLLAWESLATDTSDARPLVEAYVASLQTLAQFRADVDELLKAACLANLEFRQTSGETHEGARDEALQRQLASMLKKISCDWFPVRNVLNAQLISKPARVLYQQLNQAVEDAADDFVKRLFESLARLVDQEVLGLVEWLPNNCCAYHFFKQVVIQENDGASHSVEETRFSRITERDRATGRQIIGKKTTKVTRGKGRHVHRFARHQHDVMHAIQTSVGNSTVVMPPQVVRLCRAIPAWLEPFVRVIDGTIVRERIIERDVEVTNWQDVEVHDEPIIGCEPAVIVGPYVLTGWGPREVRDEELRRTSVEQLANETIAVSVATRRFPILMAVAIAIAGVSVGLTLQALSGQVSAWAATASCVAAIVCAWYAAMDYAQVRRLLPAWKWAALTSVSIASQFGLLLWAIVRLQQPVTWVIPVILVFGAIAGHALAARIGHSHHK